jgi:hypothetical protein
MISDKMMSTSSEQKLQVFMETEAIIEQATQG